MAEQAPSSQPPKSATTGDETITWLNTVKNIISALLNLTAIVGISGYEVITSYLSRYTGIYSYNISITQYLAAGLGYLLVAAVVILILAIAAIIFDLIVVCILI